MSALKKTLIAGVAIATLSGAAFWTLTVPNFLDERVLAALPEGDAEHGKDVFWASGCASCHAAPGASGDDRFNLSGGMRFETEFGTFVAPNISQHMRDGIGGWSKADLANAMMRGISPEGNHYYPAFPYTSYARMSGGDISDLYAFLKTLPEIEGVAGYNELSFPFNVRRGVGLWKQLYLNPAPAVALENPDEQVVRGQYLVEGPGHCAECHTPRNVLGGLDKSRWLAGSISPETGRPIDNITSGEGGIRDWSEDDIAALLETGFTPDFDSVGGTMAAVVRNMAELPASDREAIAAYLKAIPAHANAY